MLTNSDVAKVYDTILSIPGMNEDVKLNLKLSRKNVLILYQVIQRGLAVKDDDRLMPIGISKDVVSELSAWADDCLTKAGLSELSERLQSLGGK